MLVTHIEWENEFNVIIFQCGWYRGISVYLALEEQAVLSGRFLVIKNVWRECKNNSYPVPHLSIPEN